MAVSFFAQKNARGCLTARKCWQ